MHAHRIHLKAAWFLSLAPAAIGCQQDPGAAASGDAPVATAYQALAAEVAACGQAFEDCAVEAAGDADAIVACRDEFGACREAAGTPQMNEIGSAVRGCADAAHDCFAEARDADSASSCREALGACLGTQSPVEPGKPDDLPDAGMGRGMSMGTGPAAEIGGCIDALRACIEGDGAAMDCAFEARACVVSAVPAPDGAIPGLPTDPGMPSDPGMPDTTPAPQDPGVPSDPGMPDTTPAPEDPGPPEMPDTPAPEDPQAEAMTCMDQYDACVEAGGSARQCGMAQRECGRP